VGADGRASDGATVCGLDSAMLDRVQQFLR
jgi:hypothetical protein